MRKTSTTTIASKNRTPGDFDQAGFTWHSGTFLTVRWLLALGPIRREERLPEGPVQDRGGAGAARRRSRFARQRLVRTQALLTSYHGKLPGRGKVLRAGAALSLGQAASRSEPPNRVFACWDRSPGLHPRSQPQSGQETASGPASGHAHPRPTAAQVPPPKEGLSFKVATGTCSLANQPQGPPRQNPVLHRHYVGGHVSV